MIWFNLPYSRAAKTNIEIFFNKNTLKHNYSCMPNMKSKFNGHNKNILTFKPSEPQKRWN